MLYIFPNYHCMQFHGKRTNQTKESGKKPSFRPDFGPFEPNLGPKTFFIDFSSNRYWALSKLSLYIISRENNEPNLRKRQKN